MQTNSNPPQPPQTYFLQRPKSPNHIIGPAPSYKNSSLTLSIGANQSASQLVPPHKFKIVDIAGKVGRPSADQQPPTLQKLQQDLRLSAKQNNALRQENSQLRRQLLKMRREPTFENSRSMDKLSLSPDFSDLRGTIKKEMGELKDLRAKVEALSSQCRLYEETVEKMEERIRKLVLQNNKKKNEIEELQSQLSHLSHLKDRTNGVVRLYNQLQGKFNAEQLQWLRWKQNWLGEKECYLERIRELQRITERMFR